MTLNKFINKIIHVGEQSKEVFMPLYFDEESEGLYLRINDEDGVLFLKSSDSDYVTMFTAVPNKGQSAGNLRMYDIKSFILAEILYHWRLQDIKDVEDFFPVVLSFKVGLPYSTVSTVKILKEIERLNLDATVTVNGNTVKVEVSG